MSSLRIAAAQSVSVAGDVAANVAEHCHFIAEAAARGVHLLVFPELSLCGYELPLMGACCLQPEDEVLAPIRALACDKGMAVVVGAPIRSTPNHVHIGAITFHPNGDASIYCKQYLHAGEERFATAGTQPCGTYPVGGEAVALAICADTAHEQHPQAAAAVGASVYLASVLVSDAGYATDAGHLQRYAERYRMATLMANHGGPTGGYVSAGKSAFWSAQGRLVVTAPGVGRCLVMASRHADAWDGEVHRIES